MRTIIYVDGFNLYYRMLRGRPECKWLNPLKLAEVCLKPNNDIVHLRYFTARVSGRTDPEAPGRQQRYLKALTTVPNLSIHFGSFLSSTKFAGLVHPPDFRPAPASPMAEPWPDVVKVHKTEEKGSDVNLACHLLLDAFRQRFDVGVVLSNDSDLVEPIRIATQDLGCTIGLLSPVGNPNPALRQASSFVRRINTADLVAAQFSDIVVTMDGSEAIRPAEWSHSCNTD
jgi:hypothetical protein